MAIQEVRREHTADANAIPDPKIVKIAKLSVILADPVIEDGVKVACLRIATRTGIVTEEEAKQLLMYRRDLEEVLNHEDQEGI